MSRHGNCATACGREEEDEDEDKEEEENKGKGEERTERERESERERERERGKEGTTYKEEIGREWSDHRLDPLSEEECGVKGWRDGCVSYFLQVAIKEWTDTNPVLSPPAALNSGAFQ